MFKYLNDSECKVLEKGFKQILTIKLLATDPNLKSYYTGELELEKALNIYMKISSLNYLNRTKFDELYVIKGYLSKLFNCTYQELELFMGMYTLRGKTDLSEIVIFKRILDDKDYDLFFEGKLSLEKAIEFYNRITKVKLLSALFPTASKTMYQYIKDIVKYDYDRLKKLYSDIPEYYCENECDELTDWEQEYDSDKCYSVLIKSIENVTKRDVVTSDFYELVSTPKCFIENIDVFDSVRTSILNHLGMDDRFAMLTTESLENDEVMKKIYEDISEEYNGSLDDTGNSICIKDMKMSYVDQVLINKAISCSGSIKSEIYTGEENLYLTISENTLYSGISFNAFVRLMISLILNK